MGVIFLFDVSVVLSVIGTSVIRIKSENRKRQRTFYIFGLMKDGKFTFAPNSALFSPAGGDVIVIDGDGVLTGHRFITMMDSIGFDEAGALFIFFF